jgi:hypothetical protein
MALEDVKAVIRTSLIDDVFRLSLKNNFDGTIGTTMLQLTAEERQGLKSINWDDPLGISGVTGAAAASWVHIYKTG